ncbi:MAG: VRR-NUC domain-containing protein [Actinomycetota bacterium]|nr:VRR-NUC domain-containing protein [Actinomycetota bacterium]
MTKRWVLVLLAVVLSACSQSGGDDRGGAGGTATRSEAARSSVRSGAVTIVRETSSLDAPHVVRDEVYGVDGSGRPEKLASAINTTFLGTLVPAVVPDREGRSVVYNSFHEERPIVRIHDVETDQDVMVDEGALSAAWRSDGTLAYFKGLSPEIRNPRRYLGHVVATESPAASRVRWTNEPGRYVVAAWARKRLLVYRLSRKGFPDLLVFDGPQHPRPLAEDAALVAVSPDGRKAFVGRYGTSPPVVRLLDLAEGKEIARFTFGNPDARGIGGGAVTFVAESGSWTGDIVVAPVNHGLAVFRVEARRLVLEQLLRFDPDLFPIGVFEPRVDDSGQTIVMWAELQSRPRQAIPPAALLECDRIALECVQGPKASSIPGPRIVYNPSRP